MNKATYAFCVIKSQLYVIELCTPSPPSPAADVTFNERLTRPRTV
jgi:hypothetical protein